MLLILVFLFFSVNFIANDTNPNKNSEEQFEIINVGPNDSLTSIAFQHQMRYF